MVYKMPCSIGEDSSKQVSRTIYLCNSFHVASRLHINKKMLEVTPILA